jgi:hypothetical protein
LADVGILYRNFGNSQALKVVADYQLGIGEAPPDDESQWTAHTAPTKSDCVSEAEKKFGIPVFQQHEPEGMVERIPSEKRPSFSEPDVKAVLADKKGLYITGCIVYHDGAGNIYHTYVCMSYTPQAGPMQNQFSLCPVGNVVQ